MPNPDDRPHRVARSTVSAFLVATAIACSGGGGASVPVASTQPDQTAGIAVSPAAPSVTVGASVDFTATAVRSDGSVIGPATGITWSVNDASRGSVSSAGRFTAIGEGTVFVNATTSAGRIGQAVVTIRAASGGGGSGGGGGGSGGTTIASVSVTPASASLVVGASQQLTATARDAAGNTIAGQSFSWTTSAASVASVSPTGLVAGVAPGTATVTATSVADPTRSATSAITVTAASGGGGGGGSGVTIAQVSTGAQNACAVTTSGVGYCWGAGSSGIVANGQGISSTFHYTPVAIVGGHTWRQISVGSGHACGVTTANALYCWGLNTANGQLGTGSTTTENRTTPQPVGAGISFASVSAGSQHSCALTTTGVAYCWGRNEVGALGDGVVVGSPLVRPAPFAVAGGHTFVSIAAAGLRNTCGVRTGGTILCWGDGQGGRLGRPYILSTGDVSNLTPTAVSFTFTATSVVAGNSHFCALGANATLACWGSAQSGQLGRAGTAGETTFVPNIVSTGAFSDFSASIAASCGLVGTTAYCWGENGSGTLGDGSYTNRTSPTAVAGGLSFKRLGSATVSYTSCGITTADELYCWGSGSYGLLGQGTSVITSNVPLRVRFP